MYTVLQSQKAVRVAALPPLGFAEQYSMNYR